MPTSLVIQLRVGKMFLYFLCHQHGTVTFPLQCLLYSAGFFTSVFLSLSCSTTNPAINVPQRALIHLQWITPGLPSTPKQTCPVLPPKARHSLLPKAADEQGCFGTSRFDE